ncbi:MAG: ribbon-helix-helix protein, CopG family [Acidobacteriota bacterium]
MKTIAVSIDEASLERLDHLAAAGRRRRRSALVRIAVREYLDRAMKQDAESRESEILHRHRHRLARQAAALIKQQAGR